MNESNTRSLVIAVICCLCMSTAMPQSNAQTLYKTFYSAKGNKVDSTSAKSYVLLQQLGDSVWIMQQYNMEGFMLRAGTYKDADLKVPHGKLISFSKLLSVEKKKKNTAIDTLNYLSDTQFYKDGVATGKWTIHFDDGNPQFINSHDNGKLTGLHQTFNYGDKTLLLSGTYLDGQRVGVWQTFDRRGNVVLKETYGQGKLLETVQNSYHFRDATPPRAFYEYINSNVTNIVKGQIPKITFFCKVTDEGKLIDPIIQGIGISAEMEKQLADLVIACGNWKPTFDKELKKNVEDKVSFIVRIANGRAQTYCSYFYDNEVRWIKH